MADLVVMRSSMADIFQQSQHSISAHKILAQKLHKGLHEVASEHGKTSEFNRMFMQFVLRILPVAKNEPAGDRAVAFVASYFGQLLKSTQNDGEEDADANTSLYDPVLEGHYAFMESVLKHIRPGMTAKDKHVRYRSSQLTLAILKSAAEISDNTAVATRESAIGRTFDKDHSVRIQATLILSLLVDNEEPATAAHVRARLLELSESDPSPEVRRVASLNLPHERDYYPAIVARARDVNALTRAAVFNRLVPSLGDFRQLRIHEREALLSAGLKDRNVSVREAAAKMLVNNWLKIVDNDLISLLHRLDVVDSRVADTALEAFFDARRDVVETKMYFDDEFYEDMSAEGVLLMRCFHDFCLKHDLTALIDERLPVLSQLAYYIDTYWTRRLEAWRRAAEQPEIDEREFIVEQLLLVAKDYDLSDEAGRRMLVAALRTVLMNASNASERIVRLIMQIYRKMAVSDHDFLLTTLELADDVQDALMAVTEVEDADISREDAASRDLTSMLVCLSIVEESLRLIENQVEDKVHLMALYTSYVQPALASAETTIGLRGIYGLSLLCLLNRSICEFGVDLLVDFYSSNVGDDFRPERRVILQGLSDIILVQGVFFQSAAVLLVQALEDGSDPEAQAVSARALAKILLSGMTTDEGLLKALLIAYYKPVNYDNLALKQALSFFFTVYSSSLGENQQRVARVAPSALDAAVKSTAVEDQPNADRVSATQLINQLVDWTDPRGLRVGTSGAHAVLAAQLLELIDDTTQKKYLRSLAGGLAKLFLEQSEPLSQLTGLREHVLHVLQLDSVEGLVATAINRFREALETAISRASQNQHKGDEDQEMGEAHGHDDSGELADVPAVVKEEPSESQVIPTDLGEVSVQVVSEEGDHNE